MNNIEYESKLGNVSISPKAIAQVAGDSATSCFGVVGMAEVSIYQGIVKLLTQDSKTKGVEVSISDDLISIGLHIIVAYGVNVNSVSENLIENVKYKVENFTGLSVSEVFVYVEGIRVID